jgi:hypothetical protein
LKYNPKRRQNQSTANCVDLNERVSAFVFVIGKKEEDSLTPSDTNFIGMTFDAGDVLFVEFTLTMN